MLEFLKRIFNPEPSSVTARERLRYAPGNGGVEEPRQDTHCPRKETHQREDCRREEGRIASCAREPPIR